MHNLPHAIHFCNLSCSFLNLHVQRLDPAVNTALQPVSTQNSSVQQTTQQLPTAACARTPQVFESQLELASGQSVGRLLRLTRAAALVS